MSEPTNPAGRDLRHEPELYVLFALALVSRFWGIGQPNAAIFDETLFEPYISHYFTHTFYFNLHPPVGKLILAFGAWILNIDPVALAHADSAVALRVFPAIAGALIIPVFHVLLRQLGATRRVATLGAFLLLCDNMLLVVSRFILIDAFLLLFILGSVSAYLAAQSRKGEPRLAFVLLSALLAGLAVGTKLTGLAALGVVGVIWLRGFVRRGGVDRATNSRALVSDAAIFATVPAAIYVAAFAIHFSLLPLSGGRDDTLMSREFQSTLQGNPAYDPDATISLPAMLRDAHVAMRRGNTEYVGDRNPNSTPWYSWPVLWRAPYVWEGWDLVPGSAEHVVLLGNLVVWWAALLGALTCVLLAAVSRGFRARLMVRGDALMLLGAAWVISYLPLALVSRELFIYSYLPPLTFSLAFAVVGCGELAGWMRDDAIGAWHFASLRSVGVYAGVAALALAWYAVFLPLTTGGRITDISWERRLWFTGRHDGGTHRLGDAPAPVATGAILVARR